MNPLADPPQSSYQTNMVKAAEIESIETRHREIAKEIERLQKEAAELDVAIRVFRRFSPQDQPKLGAARPDGIPTLFVMTATVLREAEEGGRDGLTGKEIVEEIGKRWWPGVQAPQILPTVYQFVKTKRIRKTGTRFRIKRETPPELSEGASGTGEAQAPSH